MSKLIITEEDERECIDNTFKSREIFREALVAIQSFVSENPNVHKFIQKDINTIIDTALKEG